MSTARFTVRSLFCLSLSLAAFATSTPAQADGRVMRGERGVDGGRFFAENYMEELCYLNANSGAGILSVHVWPMFAQVMVARYPGTFAYVGAEECGDSIDNDCDGVVNEDCQVEPPAETWLAGADCDACMESECAPQESSCLGDADCKALIRCPAEKNCVSGTVGLLSCLCGEGVSVSQCQIDADNNDFKGACVEEFSLDKIITSPEGHTPLDNLVRIETPLGKAGRAYTCMARRCRERCADNMFDVEAGPLCGNGVVEEGEQCDDGNQVEGDDCSNDCKSGAEPTWGEGSQGVQCDECMDRECKDTAESCLSDATCFGVAMCYAREACLDRNLGSVPCLCGPGVSPLECQQSKSVAGPCKDTILSALGMDSESLPAEVFTRFSMGATRPANSTGICMMRKCSAECSHNLAQ